MFDRGLYLGALAAVAAGAAVNYFGAAAWAEGAAFDSASMMQEINADLDRQNQQFTLALVKQSNDKFEARMAKIENVFTPLTQPTAYDFSVARTETQAGLELAAVSKAEFEISKKVANMENPFEPRLPMPPLMIAIDNEAY